MGAIVLDTETSGLSPSDDRICEIAILSFDTGEVLLHSLINPEIIMSDVVIGIHGITNEAVTDAPVFADVAPMIADIINRADALIAHNPSYDRNMLAASFVRCGIVVSFPTLICTKRIWDLHEPRENRHLMNAYKRFVSRDGFKGAHGAMQDTKACYEIFKAQVLEFRLDLRWEELDPDQKRWWGPSNHVVIVDGVLIFTVGKNKGTPCHAIEKSFWRWLVNQDFPEHVKELADYLTVVKPECTGEELYGWAYGRIS